MLLPILCLCHFAYLLCVFCKFCVVSNSPYPSPGLSNSYQPSSFTRVSELRGISQQHSLQSHSYSMTRSSVSLLSWLISLSISCGILSGSDPSVDGISSIIYHVLELRETTAVFWNQANTGNGFQVFLLLSLAFPRVSSSIGTSTFQGASFCRSYVPGILRP